jgi:PAS domain S-box-containing protein
MKDRTDSSERILIVDDSPETLNVISSALERENYQVSVAKTGEKAIRIATDYNPDLILLDVLMPGLDGYETCRLLKGNDKTKGIPIIFLTGISDVKDKVKGFALGAVDFLIKPIEIEELLVRVKTHVSINSLKMKLLEANKNLEEKVAARTLELTKLNKQLTDEIEEKKEAEFEIRSKNEELYAAYEQLSAVEEELRANYDELTTSEQKFRDVLENSNVALYKQNYITETYDYMSPAFTDITGYSVEEILNTSIYNIFEMFHPDDTEKIYDALEKNLSSGGGNFKLEYRLKNKTGKYIWVSDTGFIFIGENGKPKYSIGNIHNINDRKIAEEGLSSATRKLNYLNSFVITDIQNAIFSLNGYNQILQEFTNDESILNFVNTQSKIIDTLSELIQFSKVFQSLGIKPPRRQNVTQVFLFGVSHLDMSPYTRVLDLEGIEIFADPLLEQVFYTLADNVIQHSITASTIRLWYQETEEGLTLIFEDNGQGIPEDIKAIIFEKETGNKKVSGLFLAREILSITNIRINETGSYGKGAKFEINIPKDSYWIVN